MKSTLLLIISFWSTQLFCQSINNVGEVRVGSDDSYYLNSVVYQGDVYFIGPANTTSSFRSVYKYNDDTGEISKAINESTVFLTTYLLANESSFYLTDSPFGERDLYRTQGTNSSTTLVKEFEDIDQREILSNGVVVVDEINFNGDRDVYFINHNSSVAHKFVDNVNIGFNDFVISNTDNFVFATPEDDDDYDGGSFFFDASTNTAMTGKEVITDAPCDTLTQVRGFGDYIFYKCDNTSYLYNTATLTSVELDLPNSDIDATDHNDDYIFIGYTFGRLHAIDKLSGYVGQIASDLAIFPRFASTENRVYFVDNGDIYSHDGIQGIQYEYNLDDNDVVTAVQIINDIPHVLVERQFGLPDQIVALDSDTETGILITEMRITASGEYGFHKVNNSIIFAMDDEDLGMELFKLSYGPNSTSWQSIDKGEITISPNPVRDLLNIDISNIESKNLRIRILNAMGVEQFHGTYKTSLNISDFSPGTYFMIVQDMESGNWHSKFSKL